MFLAYVHVIYLLQQVIDQDPPQPHKLHINNTQPNIMTLYMAYKPFFLTPFITIMVPLITFNIPCPPLNK